MVSTPIKPSAIQKLTIDREQASRQLELLGYRKGDNIYMRFFVPDGDPRHGTPAAARKANKLNWEEVERYQNDGYGVYFVVNGGGHTDKDVHQGRALFCEWDDRPIEDQIFAWQELDLPGPSMQVCTRKSVHNYWRADLTKEQWLELQQDLLAYTQSDQKLKNPSRVLRLAGAWHIKPGCEPIRCDIIHQSEKVYTYEELRAAIPHRQQPELPTRSYQPSIADDVPLYQFLTKDDRALIDQGAGQGSRNDSGAKLARNLIGTAQRLNHLGIHFSDDPRHLFHDYCYRCAPSLSTREAEAIWKSALKDNPTPSLTDEALENCAKAWIRNQEKSSGRGYASGSKSDTSKPTRKEIKSFCQKMYDDLFAEENYIYVFKQIHKWLGTHYEPVDNAEIIKQIHSYCDSYQVIKTKENEETGEKEDLITYPYSDPKYVNKAFEWIKQKFGINPQLVNPPGLNCVDGVLQLSYDPDSQKWIRNLIPHDPSFYYLYAPQASYEIPTAVLPDSCDRLLSCLDAPQREIFLKTIASAFDMPTVRRYRGREVRGLLLHGLGNNGKDTLREVTAMMFGYRGMVGATLSDFQQYDQGRKFPLQKLDGARVNWPSENADCMMLDRIQSLKIAITGDPLAGERKGVDEYQFRPRCPNLFNVNMPPKLQGAMEAIKSRFAILKFLKTFKSNPGPGELKADSRFLYDPEFVRTEVLPWYLHYCLDALDRLMIEGINYDVTDEAWEDLREESDHIYAFSREVGIGYKHNGILYSGEVYERLREYYIENGALEVEEFPDGRKKDRWSQNPAWGDSLVKGPNLIFPRLLKIFPQARRERDSQGRNILVGIGWVLPTPTDPNGTEGTTQENVAIGYNSERVPNVSEDGLNVFKASDTGHSERAERVLPDCRENKNDEIRVSTSVMESARNLSNAWLECKTAAEVKQLTAQYEDLKPVAWKLLTEDGRNHILNLMVEGEENAISKNESLPPKHVQYVHNGSTTGIATHSVDVQPPSEHVQKSIQEIQNEKEESAPADEPEFQKGNRVMTPKGEGVIVYFNECYNDYIVGLEHSTDHFKPEQLRLVKLQVGDCVFITHWPHTDRLGPYPIERIEGEYAKVEGFPKLLLLTDLRRA